MIAVRVPGPARTSADRRFLQLLRAVAIGVAFAWTIASGYYFIFSRFSWYDDEGYLMMSVHQVAQGRPLYDDVYSQYGPFYYLVRLALLTLLQAPVTHDLTRLVTLGTWVMTAALGGLFVHRTTRSAIAGLGVYVLLFQHLRPLAHEPGHPQELTVLLLAGFVALTAWWRAPRQASMLAVASGVLVGVIALTKINIGAYVALSAVVTLLTFARVPHRTVLLGLTCMAGMVLPWLVMREHAGSWTSGYAALVSISAGAVVAQCLAVAADRPFGATALWSAGLAAIATVLLTCMIMTALGTSVQGLVNGIVLQPLAFARTFSTAVNVADAALVASGVSLALALVFAWPARVAVGRRPIPRRLFLWLKLGGGVVGVYLATRPSSALLGAGPALLWLVLIRPTGGPWGYEQLMPRVALVSIAAWQLLQAYPVAESQVAWATYLMIPAMVVCLMDALAELRSGSVDFTAIGKGGVRGFLEVCALLTVLGVSHAFLQPELHRRAYEAGAPLSLPGADRIRLPAKDSERYQWLTAIVRERCGSLVTLPGLNSFYFWTGFEPPTGSNTTAWPILLGRDDQQRIVDRVAPDRAACVIEYEAGIRTGGRDEFVMNQPLMRFVREEFEVVEERDGYRFKTRRDRTPAGSP